jgi:N-acetylglucosaminyldiphosphoundecaprenol N-acetyl-beta-D-mannosaminyltransferase
MRGLLPAERRAAKADWNAGSPSIGLLDSLAQSNLSREVYCILGVPIDAIDLSTVVRKLEIAAADHATLLVSTPNLNFLVNSISDAEFRQSLLDSDLCPPDGTPIIWIARLLGLPIAQRAAGADLLDRLRTNAGAGRPLTLFLFGGAKGVADAAARAINGTTGSLGCVGSLDPGFGEVNELSQDNIIQAVNSSGADFLVVSLGAKKGQLWLQRNHHRLTIPIRAHLGAAIGFQAGVIKRAPPLVRAWGLEWLWRIKEENHLWKRYQHDGLVLLQLLITRVLPLAASTRWRQLTARLRSQNLTIRKQHQDEQTIRLILSGDASRNNVPVAFCAFREAVDAGQDVVIDFSETQNIDARFLGLLMMLQKELAVRGAALFFADLPPKIERTFRLSELGHLLTSCRRP